MANDSKELSVHLNTVYVVLQTIIILLSNFWTKMYVQAKYKKDEQAYICL